MRYGAPSFMRPLRYSRPAQAHRFALAAAAVITAAVGLTPAASAAGELVTRAAGPSGAPFEGKLQAVSPDGRFAIVDGPGSLAGLPAETRTLFVRDRGAATLTAVLREDGVSGAVLRSDGWDGSLGTPARDAYWAVDVSADGKRVLIHKKAIDGQDTLLVRDLAAGTTEPVTIRPDGSSTLVNGAARFVDGGTAVIFGGLAANNLVSIYRRALATDTTTIPIVTGFEEGGWGPLSFSADGKVVTWTAGLGVATAPSSAGRPSTWPSFYRTGAVGYTVAGQPSRVVSTTTVSERAGQPYPFCRDLPPTTDVTEPAGLRVDDSGHHLWLERRSKYGTDPYRTVRSWSARDTQSSAPWVGVYGSGASGTPDGFLSDIGARGEVGLFARGDLQTSGYGTRAVSADPSALLPELPALDGPRDPSRASSTDPMFFAEDRGVIRTETRVDGSGVYAYDPVGPVPAPLPSVTPVAAEGESLVSDAKANVTWASCTEPTGPLPIGDVLDYARPVIAQPVSASRSAGTVRVTLMPGKRRATAVSIRVQTLGFTTWSRTVTKDAVVALPKPYWLLPQTVVVRVIVPADVDGSPGAVLQTNPGWQALR